METRLDLVHTVCKNFQVVTFGLYHYLYVSSVLFL